MLDLTRYTQDTEPTADEIETVERLPLRRRTYTDLIREFSAERLDREIALATHYREHIECAALVAERNRRLDVARAA